jgi:CheY-like chemotaxis protein
MSADPDRLMQVMANLLSNAAKFSSPGSVVRIRASELKATVRIEVEDHGTGIPEAFRARVFEKFAQADSSSCRRFEGTGLGLSITRRLLEAMEGTIGFTTITDRGTTFYFDLPKATQSATVSREPTRAGIGPAVAEYRGMPRILHVEDDSDLSQVIEAALAGSAVLVPARTLKQAVMLLREGCFSLLLLDPVLSDGDGLTLLEQLPALTTHPLPVVILSTSEVPHDVQQRVAASLVKSRVSEAHLVETIVSWLP